MALNANGWVRVTNGLPEHISGRYDGEDYEFPPGQSVDVPQIVASHVFGFGVPDKANVLARLGWASSSDKIKDAMVRLREIRFEEVVMTARPVVEPDSPASGDMVPAPAVDPRIGFGGAEGASAPDVSDQPDVI